MKSLNERLMEVKQYQKQNANNECSYEKKKEDEAIKKPEVQPSATTDMEKRSSFRKTASTTDEFGNNGKQVTDPHLLKLLNSLPRPITRQVQNSTGTIKIEKVPLNSYIDSSQFSGINYGRIISDEVIATDRLLVEAAKKTMDVAGTTALIALVEGK